MKKIFKHWGLLIPIFCVVSFYNCSQEEMTEINNSLESIDEPCTITIDLNDTNSRLAFGLEGNSLKSTWSEGDKFEIHDNDEIYTFTLDEGCEGSAVGTFTSSTTPPINLSDINSNFYYRVYYPSKTGYETISFANQEQVGDNDTRHLKDMITMTHVVGHYTDIRFIPEDYTTTNIQIGNLSYKVTTQGSNFRKNTILKINVSNLPVDFQPVSLELEFLNPLSPSVISPFYSYNTQNSFTSVDAKMSMTLKDFNKDKSFVAYMAQAVHIRTLPQGSMLRLTIKDADGETYYADKEFNSQKTITAGALAILNYSSGWVKGNNSNYTSQNKSNDGEYVQLQAADVDNGINIVFMGDGFSDRQIADGTYEDVMNMGYEAFFSEEPFYSFKKYFNVYYVIAVSDKEGCSESAVSSSPNNTIFKTYFGDGTTVGGDDNVVKTYTKKIPALENIDDRHLTSIVMLNSTKYAGTCYMYYSSVCQNGEGYSVSYFPIGSSYEALRRVLTHEANGHGFGKLADEYDSGGNSFCTLSNLKNSYNPMGWHLNIDNVSEPSQTIWSEFYNIDYYRYNEGVGSYAGAYTWPADNDPIFYRPTNTSIMRYNTGGFNAPSRKAIYVRMHKMVYGADWTWEDYKDEFLDWDSNRVKTSYSSTAARSVSGEDFVPLASPVIIPLNQ